MKQLLPLFMKKLSIFLLLSSLSTFSYSQSQSNEYPIEGIVLETIINTPLLEVLIYDNARDTVLGVTDVAGRFHLDMELGRHLLSFRKLGYGSVLVEVNVRAVTDNISVTMDLVDLMAYDVSITAMRSEPIGAKRFSVEQSQRYAGTLGDPARMVRSFAGVQSLDASRNDIIIRGNSPTGLQWIVDGIEIPNPNHYGGMGLTGSTVTLLNTNLLSNSDFYLGGWSAEYGNATSGVFDLKMRGANEITKNSQWFQMGWNGFELGLEGNFDKKKKTTYMADYRYSFLGLMDKMGIDVGLTPEYQDFTFKTTAKLTDKQSLSLLGIWGTSQLVINDLSTKGDTTSINTGSDTYIGALTHNYQINSNHNLTSQVSYIKNVVRTEVGSDGKQQWIEDSYEDKISADTKYTVKLRNSQNFVAGAIYDYFKVNYDEKADINNILTQINDEQGNLSLIRFYAQYQTSLFKKVRATLGLHSSYLTLNGSYAIEPRVSFKYSINDKNNLTLSTGLYSQMQIRPLYFIKDSVGNQPNIDLGFTRNAQAVIAHNWRFLPEWNLRTEVYYQYLYDVPVMNDPNAIFSTLNLGGDYYIDRVQDSLVNKGEGFNYGLEVTLERYFSKNYYVLLTGSLYSSKYTNGFNDTKYNTKFNGNYMFNISTGYELPIKKRYILAVDVKSTYGGSRRYTPLDQQASITSGNKVFDNSKAFTSRYTPYFSTDLKISFKINFPTYNYDFSFDLLNLTDHKNINTLDYNVTPEGNIEEVVFYQQGLFPMFTFKMTF